MENEKLLSEERYQRNNKKVKRVGKILLIVGIITLVLSFIILFFGFMGFGNTFKSGIQSIETGNMNKIVKGTFGSVGIVALGGFINMIGFILTIAGGITMFVAHRREITAYTTQQVMPVAQEGIEKITPTVANTAKTISQSISKGIQEGKKEAGDN